MNATIHGNSVVVRLSETNLVVLLHKLRTQSATEGLMRQCANDVLLRVIPERDEDHYEGRAKGREISDYPGAEAI